MNYLADSSLWNLGEAKSSSFSDSLHSDNYHETLEAVQNFCSSHFDEDVEWLNFDSDDEIEVGSQYYFPTVIECCNWGYLQSSAFG